MVALNLQLIVHLKKSPRFKFVYKMDSYEMTVHRIVTTLNGFIEPPVQLKQRTVDKLNSEFRVGAMGVGHELLDLGDSNINMSINSLPKIRPFFTYVLRTALSAHYLNDVFS